MKQFSSLVLGLVLCFSFAQNIEQISDYNFSSIEDVVEQLEDANDEVLLATVSLQERAIAEALHQAVTERGLQVFVLSPEDKVEDRANFVQSLALAGATVRFGAVGNDFVIIDRKFVFASSDEGFEESYSFENSRHGTYFASVFRQAFLQGTVYDPLLSFEEEE